MSVKTSPQWSNHPRLVVGSRPASREGAVAVFAAVMLVVVIAMVACAIDLGYVALAKTETQRTADAAAHAAVIELTRTQDINQANWYVHRASSGYSAANPVLGKTAKIAHDEDLTLGRYEFGSGQTELQFGDPATYNAVRARVRRTADQNGTVGLFFASVLGLDGQEVESDAIAAVVRNVSGFKIPASGEHVPMLPITVSASHWEKAFGDSGGGNGGGDDWGYDSDTKTVYPGSDGKLEMSIFPNNTGNSGNLGTVNIGITENSTSYIANQVQNGLSASDVDYHGGSLELDSSGSLGLSGNPGLSASLQNDLASIAGEVRIILIHDSVSGGGGNNANFNVVRFEAVRIMSANLSGGSKAVSVQPASLKFDGVIQGSSAGSSRGIYSSIQIVN